MMALPANRRRISGRRLSPPEKYYNDGSANQSSRIALSNDSVSNNAVYTCNLIVTSLKVLFIRNKVKVAPLLLQLQSVTSLCHLNLHLRASRFWNPRNLCLWNPELGA